MATALLVPSHVKNLFALIFVFSFLGVVTVLGRVQTYLLSLVPS